MSNAKKHNEKGYGIGKYAWRNKNLLDRDASLEALRGYSIERLKIVNMPFYKLENEHFKHIYAKNCDFFSMIFYGIIFEDCDFSNASFRACRISNCQFIRCDFTGIDFQFTDFKGGTVFKSCKMSDELRDYVSNIQE